MIWIKMPFRILIAIVSLFPLLMAGITIWILSDRGFRDSMSQPMHLIVEMLEGGY